MFDRVLIGRYIQGDSWLHRLDPRTKLLATLYLIGIIFLANNWLGYALLCLVILLLVHLSGIEPRFFLKGIRPMVWLILFTVIFQVLFTKGETILFQWGVLQISKEGLINGVFIFLRLVLIIMASTLLTLTTAPLELADGLEHLFRPLSRFGFPSHELALMLSIALRYVPTLMDEAQKITNAQRARGVEFNQGSFLQRVRAVIPVLVPLFVSAFNRAEDMAIAMEARGYRGGEGRTKYRQLNYHRADGILVLALIGVTVLLVGTRQLV